VAEKPVRYNGKGFSLRAEKNRLAMPASLRKDVATSSGGERRLCIAKHHKWNCLIGFGLSRLETFDTWLDSEQARYTSLGEDFDRDALSMSLYGYEEVPFDASGRFVLNDDLAEMGNLRDEVFFHGAGEFFTMWAPDELYAMGPQFDAAKISCRRLQGEAGKGKRK
jgi:MraZ protein